MNQKQIDELKKLAQKATPGPWVANTDGEGSLCEAKYSDGERHIIIEPAEWDDAAYIAAANPTTILALISEIERLEKEADWLAKQLEIAGAYDDIPVFRVQAKWREAARKALGVD